MQWSLVLTSGALALMPADSPGHLLSLCTLAFSFNSASLLLCCKFFLTFTTKLSLCELPEFLHASRAPVHFGFPGFMSTAACILSFVFVSVSPPRENLTFFYLKNEESCFQLVHLSKLYETFIAVANWVLLKNLKENIEKMEV